MENSDDTHDCVCKLRSSYANLTHNRLGYIRLHHFLDAARVQFTQAWSHPLKESFLQWLARVEPTAISKTL